MNFSSAQVNELQNERAVVAERCQRLTEKYLVRTYADRRAREFATHGLSRRLKTLTRCIDNVFSLLPPDRHDLPQRDELTDAVINIQAFVFNVFGVTDNLAWIWVHEKQLRKPDGAPIPDVRVGIRETNDLVRASFSNEFQEYLKKLDAWFKLLENFRHALAHRIPLYIPPSVVPFANADAFREFEAKISQAIVAGEYALSERLQAEQDNLGTFRPCMTHSFEEEANIIFFHAQLLADFNTVDEIASKMLIELDGCA